MKDKERIKRSEEMSKDEYRAFIRWVNRFPTKQDCAEILDVTRVTLDRVIDTGFGKPGTLEKIRKEISQLA